MLWKVAGNELAYHATEIGGHQHVLQPLHLLQRKRSVCGFKEIGKVQHRVKNALDGDTVWNLSVGVEVFKSWPLRLAESEVELPLSHGSALSDVANTYGPRMPVVIRLSKDKSRG